jgi:hypothetical protein
MNLIRLGISSWIIILNILLIIALITGLLYNKRDFFVNYPQQINPYEAPKSNPEAITANNNYASILMYIKKNPDKSAKFISDIKQKFFNDNCSVKNTIDFKSIATMPFGMPFS